MFVFVLSVHTRLHFIPQVIKEVYQHGEKLKDEFQDLECFFFHRTTDFEVSSSHYAPGCCSAEHVLFIR